VLLSFLTHRLEAAGAAATRHKHEGGHGRKQKPAGQKKMNFSKAISKGLLIFF